MAAPEVPLGPPADPLLRRALKAETEKDSVEIGTPGKGGAVKVYGDMDDVEGFIHKLSNASVVLAKAREYLGERP